MLPHKFELFSVLVVHGKKVPSIAVGSSVLCVTDTVFRGNLSVG